MSTPLMHILDLDLPEQNIEYFTAWYAGRHASDLFYCQYDNITSYRVIDGDMTMLDLYQIPAFEVFESEAYLAQRDQDPYAIEAGSPATNASTTIYEYAAEATGVNDNPTARLDADWISVIRFEADSDARARVAAALTDPSGTTRESLVERGSGPLRLLVKGRPHPFVPSQRPNAALVIEWNQEPPSRAEILEVLAAPLDTLDVAVTTAARLYPWPNNRSLRA